VNETIAISTPAGSTDVAPALPMLAKQTKAEFLRLLRTPAFSISSVLLPIIFFVFFGLPNTHNTTAGVKTSAYLIVSFGAYGIMSVSLFAFGVSLAVERGQRMNVLMRATPLLPWVYLLAKIITALAFALITLIALFVFGALVGGINLSAGTWLAITLRLLIGVLPFIALGFAIGYFATPNSAAPITQLIFLPVSFASGLFLPLNQMPDVIQKIAPYLPSFRVGDLGWGALGATSHSAASDALWLIGYAAIFFVLALRGYRREEQSRFS
jgi:ABC-2 type transport system permease protein